MTLSEMPLRLRRYVVAVVIGGPLFVAAMAVAAAMTARGDGGMDAAAWLRAVVLTVLVAVSYGRPLRVAHKFSYDVSEVGHVAMILLFPGWLPGILVGIAGGAHLLKRSAWRHGEFFNVAQVMIYVTAGALTLELLTGLPDLGPAPAGLPPLGAIVVAAVVMLMANMALVAGAISLQTSARFWRQFRGHVFGMAGIFAMLVALGVVSALIVRDYPIALAPLILPAALAQYALWREVQLRADTRAALAALVDVVELRDPYTAGHSERVAALARGLAIRMGLTGEEADLVETAGRVHDLGKVGMNPVLLSKSGPLEDDDWRQIRQHPVHGAAIVGRFAGYRGCAVLVRHHHERWDGAGYPAGIAGEDIPLGARILAVADAYDAMTSARAYRPAMGKEKVLAILESGAGAQWDPRAVSTFVEWQREEATAADQALAARPALA